MAAPARRGHSGVVVGVMLVVLALGVVILALDESTPRPQRQALGSVHGTRPPRLGATDIARAAAGFGIRSEPERVDGGWEAEDDVRSLYLLRAPSAWYVTFEDASTVLGPAGDRAVICASPEAPFACTVPGVELVADAAAQPPDPLTARRAARRTLSRAGLLVGDWRVVVLEPSADVPPCRADLHTEFDCTRQVVPTRAVMLSRDFGPGTTDARFGVVVGPRGNVLSATGRVAERRHE